MLPHTTRPVQADQALMSQQPRAGHVKRGRRNRPLFFSGNLARVHRQNVGFTFMLSMIVVSKADFQSVSLSRRPALTMKS